MLGKISTFNTGGENSLVRSGPRDLRTKILSFLSFFFNFLMRPREEKTKHYDKVRYKYLSFFG